MRHIICRVSATETGARVLCEVDYELSYVHRSRGLILRAGIFRIF